MGYPTDQDFEEAHRNMMPPAQRAVSSIVGSQQYRRGFKLVEDREGNIVLTYVENSDSPFRSPVVVTNAFDSWSQALNYLKIWDLLSHVRWW